METHLEATNAHARGQMGGCPPRRPRKKRTTVSAARPSRPGREYFLRRAERKGCYHCAVQAHAEGPHLPSGGDGSQDIRRLFKRCADARGLVFSDHDHGRPLELGQERTHAALPDGYRLWRREGGRHPHEGSEAVVQERGAVILTDPFAAPSPRTVRDAEHNRDQPHPIAGCRRGHVVTRLVYETGLQPVHAGVAPQQGVAVRLRDGVRRLPPVMFSGRG